MFNIPHVNTHDQEIWSHNRSILINRLHKICRANSIGFSTNISDVSLLTSAEKIVEFWPGDLIKDVKHWQSINRHCQQTGVTLFIFTDNFIDIDDLEHVKFYSDPTLQAMCYAFNEKDAAINANPSRLYNCFIQRVDSVRQSWFYFLYLRGLLDKGYVSFLLKQLASYSTLTGVELFDYIHNNYNLANVPNFHNAYEALRSLVPYRNFTEIKDLPVYIKDSKYSLVLDTYASDLAADRWFVSEKVIRALCFSSIPLLFIQPGAVKKLKSIGFEIDYHDHYDSNNWIDTQISLLNIVEHDAIDSSLKKNYNRAMHNGEICKAVHQRCLANNYFDEFITKVLEH